MYCRKNPFKDEIYKPRKSHRNNPSFSSTLLDEIYRSIDNTNVDKVEDLKIQRDKSLKRQSSFRACLVEKWMENEKVVHRRRPSLLQSSGSMFSRSDSSGTPSSSDNRRKSNVSCHVILSQEYHDHHQKVDQFKSKSRAIRIYTNLKKMKQPISPGGRITSFINSLFKNISSNKKSKTVDTKKEFRDLKSNKSSSPSTYSSTSSFSRACLSTSSTSTKSRDEMRTGIERTTVMRLHPVSSIYVDQDSRKPPLPPNASLREKNRKIEEAKQNVMKVYNDFSMLSVDEDEVEDDDGISDSSSDLFELDHMALFGNSRYCEELPVYETTRFDINRAIASVL